MSDPAAELRDRNREIFVCHIARDIMASGGGEVVKQVSRHMADLGARVVVITDTPDVDMGSAVQVRQTLLGARLLKWKPRSRIGWVVRHALQISTFTVFSSLVAIRYRLQRAVIFNHNCESLVGQVLVMHNVFSAELKRRELGTPGVIKAMANPVRLLRIAKELTLSAEPFGRKLVAVSPAAQRDVVALGSSARTTTIPNGVDLETFRLDPAVPDPDILRNWLAQNPLAIQVLFIGHEYARKGLDDLLGALSHLPSDFSLMVVGGMSQDTAKYAALARNLGISDRVLFAGEHGDVRPFIRASSVFCLPSYYETMPLVALEAWASGRPAVLTAECPAAELLQPGVNGELTGHNPSDISGAILKAASLGLLPGRHLQIRSLVAEHGWESAAKSYLELARNIEDGARRRRSKRRRTSDA